MTRRRFTLDAAGKAAASTRIVAAALAIAVTAKAAGAQAAPCDVFCHSRLAARAEAAGDYATYQAHVRAVAALAPSHPGVVFQLARTFARAGNPDSAIAALVRLGRMGDARDPNADSVFAPLRRRPGYVDARNRLLANRLPILDGAVAFELADPDFIPEALAYYSTRGRFLIGSLAKRAIAVVAPNGTATRFIDGVPGLLRVVGIHLDAARDRLWFATWAPDSTHRGDSTAVPSVTRLFLADPGSGRIVRSWVPDGGRSGHLLNDFVVMADGSLFITDTERGSLYRLRSPNDTLELFMQPEPERFSATNGITATPDGRTLYVAFVEGVARVDVERRDIQLMPTADSVSAAGVDGLYWHRGDLIAVQGVPTLSRVVRYRLSPDGVRIVSGEVLERGEPVIHTPTTGTFMGTRFHYIANSQYDRLSDAGGPLLKRPGAPVRTVIRVVDIR